MFSHRVVLPFSRHKCVQLRNFEAIATTKHFHPTRDSENIVWVYNAHHSPANQISISEQCRVGVLTLLEACKVTNLLELMCPTRKFTEVPNIVFERAMSHCKRWSTIHQDNLSRNVSQSWWGCGRRIWEYSYIIHFISDHSRFWSKLWVYKSQRLVLFLSKSCVTTTFMEMRFRSLPQLERTNVWVVISRSRWLAWLRIRKNSWTNQESVQEQEKELPQSERSDNHVCKNRWSFRKCLDSVSHTVPNEDYALLHTIFCLLWLAVISQSIWWDLHRARYSLTTAAEWEVNRVVIETFCYLRLITTQSSSRLRERKILRHCFRFRQSATRTNCFFCATSRWFFLSLRRVWCACVQPITDTVTLCFKKTMSLRCRDQASNLKFSGVLFSSHSLPNANKVSSSSWSVCKIWLIDCETVVATSPSSSKTSNKNAYPMWPFPKQISVLFACSLPMKAQHNLLQMRKLLDTLSRTWR